MALSTLKGPLLISRKQKMKFINTVALFLVLNCFMSAQSASLSQKEINDNALIAKYIDSKEYGHPIIFDASNIKQFWVENSVVSKDNSILIMLDRNEKQLLQSSLYHLKLINVSGLQDCKIDIISKNSDIDFAVLDSNRNVISGERQTDTFIDYTVTSKSFHLDETNQLSFDLAFNSKSEDVLSIKKIVLSFSKNKLYLSSPGELLFSSNDLVLSGTNAEFRNDPLGIIMAGRQSKAISKYKFIVPDSKVSVSISFKNTGKTKTNVCFGLIPYAFSGEHLDRIFYPYNNSNKIFKVISTDTKEKDSIVIDSYPEWTKGCYIARNAKPDLSDIPNETLLGTIKDVKKLDNGQAEVVFDKMIQDAAEGTLVRIQNPKGFDSLIFFLAIMEPGEEKTVKATIGKDENSLEFSLKAFSKGMYSFSPFFLSNSVDPKEENIVLIRDFSITY